MDFYYPRVMPGLFLVETNPTKITNNQKDNKATSNNN